MQDTTARLERLEREVRRWRRATLGLAALMAGALALGASRAQGPQDVLRVRRLEVLRGDGVPAVVLADNTRGGGMVELLRGDDPERVARLSAEPDGGSLVLSSGGAPGERRFSELLPDAWRGRGTQDQVLWELDRAETGGGALRISDAQGETACELRTEEGGRGRVAVADGGEELTVLRPPSEEPHERLRVRALELVDAGGAVVASLAENEVGGGAFELRTKDGEAVVRLGQGPAGHGRVELRSRPGALAAELAATTSGEGLLTIYGRKDRPLVQLNPKSEGQLPLGGEFALYNHGGDRVVRLGVDTAGAGEIGVFDREGEGRVLGPR